MLDAPLCMRDQDYMAKQANMNGLWSGVYTYDLTKAPVPFTAWFDEKASTLGGTITEPNTFVPNGPDELDAVIEGIRNGLNIDFAKRYRRASSAHQEKIYYEGTANEDFTEVKGIWHFKSSKIAVGKFTLSRISKALEREGERPRAVEAVMDEDA